VEDEDLREREGARPCGEQGLQTTARQSVASMLSSRSSTAMQDPHVTDSGEVREVMDCETTEFDSSLSPPGVDATLGHGD
jgi:hypothetical protein